MNSLQQLILDLCPNGVEYKKLGEVCEVLRGKRLTKKELSDNDKYPVFHGGLEPIGYYNKNNRSAESLMIINVGASAGTVGYSRVDFWSSDGCFCLSHKPTLCQRYLFFWLQSCEKLLKSKVRRAGIPTLDNKQIENLIFPLPPLAIQQKIVEILDKFTQLEAELEAELEARRRQYTYYRDQLLSFKHLTGGGRFNVVWKTLGEIATFKRGKYFQKSDFQDEGIPCIHYGQLYTYYNTYTDRTIKFVSKEVAEKSTMIRPQSVIVTLTSENMEDVCTPLAWIGNTDVAISGHSVGLESEMNPKYIVHYLKTSHFFIEKRKKARGTKVIEIKPEDLAKIKIPIPPIEEQRRIVEILDRFEALVNDISAGLPAEISARRRQYEYYRDRLLAFPKRM